MASRKSGNSAFRRRGASGLVGFSIAGASLIFTGFVVLHRPAQGPVTATKVVAEFDTVSLPVPVKYVPAGTKVKDIQFVNISFPRQQVPDGAMTSLDAVREGTTSVSLPAKLPLYKENFVAAGSGLNPVVEQIPEGMRAMTIRVDATSAVEGWAGSGSVVDIILIEKDKTSVVAEKVKVLSAERSVSPVEGVGAPSVPSTVTVLVTQEQCLAINTAIPLGKIAFALRSTRDEGNWNGTSYTSDKLRGGMPQAVKNDPIKGYVSVQGDGPNKAFALSGGKWVKTEGIPEGFLVSRDE